MELPKRKPMRLAGYDYAQNGAYFVTICAFEKRCLFGQVVGQGLCSCRLSLIGAIVEEEIAQLQTRFPAVRVDKHVVMPNHVHLILVVDAMRQEQSPCPTIGSVVCALKSISTKRANACQQTKGRKIWQFRFHDHIIRNEKEYQKIREYIDTNALKWSEDCFYVTDVGGI